MTSAAWVMRFTGNLAYFMPEEPRKPPTHSQDSGEDFAKVLRNALKDTG